MRPASDSFHRKRSPKPLNHVSRTSRLGFPTASGRFKEPRHSTTSLRQCTAKITSTVLAVFDRPGVCILIAELADVVRSHLATELQWAGFVHATEHTNIFKGTAAQKSACHAVIWTHRPSNPACVHKPCISVTLGHDASSHAQRTTSSMIHSSIALLIYWHE